MKEASDAQHTSSSTRLILLKKIPWGGGTSIYLKLDSKLNEKGKSFWNIHINITNFSNRIPSLSVICTPLILQQINHAWSSFFRVLNKWLMYERDFWCSIHFFINSTDFAKENSVGETSIYQKLDSKLNEKGKSFWNIHINITNFSNRIPSLSVIRIILQQINHAYWSSFFRVLNKWLIRETGLCCSTHRVWTRFLFIMHINIKLTAHPINCPCSSLYNLMYILIKAKKTSSLNECRQIYIFQHWK